MEDALAPTPVFDQLMADAALGRLVRRMPKGRMILLRGKTGRWVVFARPPDGVLEKLDPQDSPETALRVALSLVGGNE